MLLLVALAGCGGAPHRTPPPSSSPSAPPTPTRLVWKSLPAASPGSFSVTGRYPQLEGADGLTLVNRALHSLVLDDSAKMRADFGATDGSASVTYGGGDAFATPGVVSVLERATFETTTGGPGVQEYWVSGTWLLPSTTQLKAADLFADPTGAWPVIGDLAHEALRTGPNACTAASVDDPLSVVDWKDPKLYAEFAVEPDGLHLGFGRYAVAEGACGSAEATISWSALRPRLGTVGRDVVSRLGA